MSVIVIYLVWHEGKGIEYSVRIELTMISLLVEVLTTTLQKEPNILKLA